MGSVASQEGWTRKGTTMSGITIRKGAMGHYVTVTYGIPGNHGANERTTGIALDNVSGYDATQFLIRLVMWALEGYKGYPPTLNK